MPTFTLGVPLKEVSERGGYYPNWIMDLHKKYGLFPMTSQLNWETKKMEYYFPGEAIGMLQDVQKLGEYGMEFSLAVEFVRYKDLYLQFAETLMPNCLDKAFLKQIATQSAMTEWEQFLFDRIVLQKIDSVRAVQNTNIDVRTYTDLKQYCARTVGRFGAAIVFNMYRYRILDRKDYSPKDYAEIPYESFEPLSSVEFGTLFATNPIMLVEQLNLPQTEKAFLLGILIGETTASLANRLQLTDQTAKETWRSIVTQIGWLAVFPYLMEEV